MSNVRGSIVAHIAAAANAVRRAIQLAQAAYPQRLKRIHVVGSPPFLASSLQLMRNCVNEKIKRRVCIIFKSPKSNTEYTDLFCPHSILATTYYA